jgi:hypothetical protein
MGSSPAVGSDPRSEPVSMTRWRLAPDQAHIRSPRVAAAPTSRVRRVGLRRPGCVFSHRRLQSGWGSDLTRTERPSLARRPWDLSALRRHGRQPAKGLLLPLKRHSHWEAGSFRIGHSFEDQNPRRSGARVRLISIISSAANLPMGPAPDERRAGRTASSGDRGGRCRSETFG